jgi:uncharacterized protein YfdQ (DUF2303 family)
MQVKILVRTWRHTPTGIENILKSVYLPHEVVDRLNQWAKENQRNLLFRKYLSPETMTPPVVTANHTFNQLWKQLQKEGFNSADDLLAVSFIHMNWIDNPETIDWDVTAKFLEKLELEQKAG